MHLQCGGNHVPARHPGMCAWVVESRGCTHREGVVAGSGGYCKVGHWASNSLHMCPMMPRRRGTPRSARIAQEQGQSPEFAALKSSVVRSTFGQDVGGCNVDCKVGQPLHNPLHMLSWVTRRWEHHRGSWVQREPRARPEGATPPPCFRACVGVLGA